MRIKKRPPNKLQNLLIILETLLLTITILSIVFN